ncbi:hypothetical protein PAMP_020124 [Pampus punctatissimus]
MCRKAPQPDRNRNTIQPCPSKASHPTASTGTDVPPSASRWKKCSWRKNGSKHRTAERLRKYLLFSLTWTPVTLPSTVQQAPEDDDLLGYFPGRV